MGEIKRVAVLVGCNYPNTGNELRGCINDVMSMKQILIERFEFKEEDIKMLTDEPAEAGSSVMPTGANIKKALADMIDCANEGDVLYFHYSGHGTLIPSLKPDQPHRKDEAIVPCDFNLITDVDFRELVNRLPAKTTFTFLSDSCHSGGLIDQEKEQIGPSTTHHHHHHHHHIIHSSRLKYIPIESILSKLKQQTNLDTPNIGTHLFHKFKQEASLSFRHLGHGHQSHDQDVAISGPTSTKSTDQGILLSGCQTNETSADIDSKDDDDGKNAHGAFSYAIEQILEKNASGVSNKELVMMARNLLHEEGMRQHPCLYCSDDNADAYFLLKSSSTSSL